MSQAGGMAAWPTVLLVATATAAVLLAGPVAGNASCAAVPAAHTNAVDACQVTLLSELHLSERLSKGAAEICSSSCRDAMNKLKKLADDCQPIR